MDYKEIVQRNHHLAFLNDNATLLAGYGRYITIAGVEKLIRDSEKTVRVNLEQNTYVASDPVLDTMQNRELFSALFKGVEIQIGWVAGPNSTMNGMEYHKSSEVIIALTDQVLLLALQSDIDVDFRFATSKAKALFLQRGDCFELFPETLHLSPCKVTDDGFKTLIILPKGTNLPLEDDSLRNNIGMQKEKDQKLLFMKNKWMLAHPDRKPLVEKGVYPGLVGDNVQVLY